MTSPITPTASPEEWTRWLAEELAVCMNGRPYVSTGHSSGASWRLGFGLVHVSTLRSFYSSRRWLEPLIQDGNHWGAELTDLGHEAITALENSNAN